MIKGSWCGWLLVAAMGVLGCAQWMSPRPYFKRDLGGYPENTEAKEKGNIQEGLISYYGNEFAGNKTASGEMYDPSELTAAHRSLPFNTTLEVTNLDNGKKVKVRVNDRGPFKRSRILDVSLAAAKKLGLTHSGVARAKLEVY